ncbi:MAG: energy-coupled thiamine transporter ThiT [Thaumarchaeota archaeon]|nr:energy-coupled thiamine transporter ThiT [Nitrososphaerota archaeon]
MAPRRSPDTRLVAEVAVMVALAVALDALRLYTLPQGGSITVGEMAPILLLALRRGARAGVFAGATLGVVDLYLAPFVVHPVQLLIDYPMAFGALGLAGLFKQRGVVYSGIGVAFAVGCRFICHFVSGVFFFFSYAPPGQSPAVYSAIYNATYLIPGLVISEFVILALVRAGALRLRI